MLFCAQLCAGGKTGGGEWGTHRPLGPGPPLRAETSILDPHLSPEVSSVGLGLAARSQTPPSADRAGLSVGMRQGPERAASTDRRPPSAEACNLRGLSHCRRLERVNVPSDTGAEGSYRPCTLRLGAQRPISRRTRPARFPHPLFLPLLVWKPQDASFRHTCHLTNSVFSVANQLGRGTLLEQRRTEGRVLSRARGCQGRSQPCPPVSPVLLRDLQPPAVPAPAFPSTPSSPVWGPPCLFMFLMKAR
ncbi:uncharacterized protein LOC118603816 isoform X3 [Rousettus aegyptiacus]|uniref:uncharacterized protein LOC118603816 isoform X3 n=1 Tax=Rousettus aegyptiacus TaxID=9407 RepID=UPI00168CE20F|nr:uncharacterized protein LOC118603816 isoform X3 [Rousettus aegyptiacus]